MTYKCSECYNYILKIISSSIIINHWCSILNVDINIDDIDNILLNLLLSTIVYNEPENINTLLIKEDFNICKNIINNVSIINYINNKETDCQLYTIVNNDTMYIIFRGTSSKKDIKIDLQMNQITYKHKIRIHKGAYIQYLSIKDDLFEIINQHINDIKKIYVSGHSLGGMLATITTPFINKFYKDFHINVYCYTYGCPRVGNKGFKHFYNKYVKSSYRITTYNDPIPKLPLSMNYMHVCKSINIKEDVNDNLHLSFMFDIPYIYRIVNLLCNINIKKLIDSHKTDYYIKIIKILKTIKNYSLTDFHVNSLKTGTIINIKNLQNNINSNDDLDYLDTFDDIDAINIINNVKITNTNRIKNKYNV